MESKCSLLLKIVENIIWKMVFFLSFSVKLPLFFVWKFHPHSNKRFKSICNLRLRKCESCIFFELNDIHVKTKEKLVFFEFTVYLHWIKHMIKYNKILSYLYFTFTLIFFFFWKMVGLVYCKMGWFFQQKLNISYTTKKIVMPFLFHL